MDTLLHQLELLLTALMGIILAVVGDMARLFHEQERGGPKVTLAHLPGSLLRGTLMGVIAVSISSFLHTSYNVPELVGGGIGGALGYLGPTIITVGFNRLLEYFSHKKD